MGFLQPIAADRLETVWDFLSQKLTLIAAGNAPKFTAGINFQPRPPVGGYPSWQLMGWVGPRAVGFQAFDISQPEPYPEVDYVNLNGQQIEVKKIYANQEPGPVIPMAQLNKLSIESPAAVSTSEVIEMDVTYRRPFRISHTAQTDMGGMVKILADSRFLVLTSASIVNNNIVWVFLPAQLGQTEALVVVSGGVKLIEQAVRYRITITPPFLPPPVIGPGATTEANKPQLTFPYPFEIRVQTALGLVKAQYPDAVLYNVSNSTAAPEGVPATELLNRMIVTCRTNTAGGSAKIESAGFNEWGPVEKGSIIVGNANIDWPVSITAEQAWEEVHREAPQLNVKSLVLMQPLYLRAPPAYYFTLSDDSVQSVPAALLEKN